MTALLAPRQIDGKTWRLGIYEHEEDTARAYDKVARALGKRVNFTEPGETKGQTSKGAEQRVADAVEAAKALVSGDKKSLDK